MNIEEHGIDRAGGRVIRWPRTYDLMVKAMSLGREGKLRRQLVEHGRVAPGETVLDVGSGTGTLLRTVREMVPGIGRLCGLEPSSEMIDYAQRLAKDAGVTLEIEQGFADRLPFQDESFDVVFCSFVIHHLLPATTKAAFSEMHRVLRPGGRLVVADFRRGHGEPLGTRIHDAVGRLLHHRGGHGAVAALERTALEEAGFDEVQEGRLVMRSVGVWIGSVRGTE